MEYSTRNGTYLQCAPARISILRVANGRPAGAALRVQVSVVDAVTNEKRKTKKSQ
jgi:hypothetical protein